MEFRGNGRSLLAPSHRSRYTVDRPRFHYFEPKGKNLPGSNVQHSEIEGLRSAWDEHLEKDWGYGKLSRDEENSIVNTKQARKSKKKRKKAQQQHLPQPNSTTSIEKHREDAQMEIHEQEECNFREPYSYLPSETPELRSPGAFQTSSAAHAQNSSLQTSQLGFERVEFTEFSFLNAPFSPSTTHQDLGEGWSLLSGPVTTRYDSQEHMSEQVHINEQSFQKEPICPTPGLKFERDAECCDNGIDGNDSDLEEGEIREFTRQVPENIKLEMDP
ncbi:hypothetical protein HYFRA_00009455 [Hymenoscyphus fraxineus]|uniref:Uncharacterized protein n=1 Tax=Hymenoscyphus fraxineus TaxID=746836 RepID=A0A9N9L313_9HELO|nr:hypothetical protein HYFRA_00009455 [Hymenoscyphus fraxineus]